ncbi:MFS transporter [Chitinophaga arvensicola]|uniref:Drug resistance transporter, EmrB/QacA subfamily n=1 Tax=Chitinophaga arvensicola TaxID=29529 RepID=A0A1I0RFX3_9BACT|nr:MFS transporter [Chitinophaga arvensicola]SEW39774.1 drug resistance transporter, EmrB/QacA subfamily [Chitinophaga arvensicola]
MTRNPGRHSKWLALTVILTAPLLYVIDIFIINMAIPGIKSGIHATDGEIQLVIAGYLLGSASFLITGGRAGDYLGRKKIFFWGMFFFTLTSCGCGLSQTPPQLNIMRFLQGVSSSLMVPQSIALIQVLFPGQQERAKAIGWYGITLSIAAIIGQMLGGYLVATHFLIPGWRLIFFINLPVGILSMWAIRKFLDETPKDTGQQFDYSGALILTTGLVCLIYPLTKGREMGWPLWAIGLMICSAFIFVYFIRHQQAKIQLRQGSLIDTALFKIREFNIGLIAVLFHFMMHTAFLLMSAVYLQNGLGYTALDCGACFLLHAVLFMISSMLAARLIVKFGKSVLQTGLIIILSSFLLQILFFRPGVGSTPVVLLIGLYGLGNGLVLPFLLNIVLKSVPVKFAGVAAGVFSTFQQTASALGISILGGIFYSVINGYHTLPDYSKALNRGLAGSIVCLGIVAWMLHLLPQTTGRNDNDIATEGI